MNHDRSFTSVQTFHTQGGVLANEVKAKMKRGNDDEMKVKMK